MKLWEIFKPENVGKQYEDNNKREYILKNNSIGCPTLYDKTGEYVTFMQYEMMNLEFIEIKSLTGWERVKLDTKYYYIDCDNEIEVTIEGREGLDNTLYNDCNYFSTKEKAEEVAREQDLYRKMKKFYDVNDGKVDWSNDDCKYHIVYDHTYKIYIIREASKIERIGMIYFSSEELASRCINEVVTPFYINEY